MSTIGNAVAAAAQTLHQAGVAEGDREALWLLAHLLGRSAGSVRACPSESLSLKAAQQYSQLVERRANREPIQYILGTEEFMGLIFKVTPAVLIPRMDTAVLVKAAAERLSGPVRLADIGTGSGAIAVALATLLPGAAVVAVDISPSALSVARENAAVNGVASRIDFRQGDLVAPLGSERFDAILSNPPYIGAEELLGLLPDVREWEPPIALTPPGADELLFYRRLAVEAVPLLKPGGFLGVEVGDGQAPAVAALLQRAGLETAVFPDSQGIERVIFGGMRQRDREN